MVKTLYAVYRVQGTRTSAIVKISNELIEEHFENGIIEI